MSHTHPPIHWLRTAMVLAVGAAGIAIVWAGVTVHGTGETRLGLGISAVGVVVFVLAAQVTV